MSTTSTVTTILTCYSSYAPNGTAKPSSCAASKKKRRRRRSIIDEQPRIEIEDGIKIEATSLSGKATNSKDHFKSIEPTRTVSESITIMTLAYPNEVNVLDAQNEFGASIPIDLEVN